MLVLPSAVQPSIRPSSQRYCIICCLISLHLPKPNTGGQTDINLVALDVTLTNPLSFA